MINKQIFFEYFPWLTLPQADGEPLIDPARVEECQVGAYTPALLEDVPLLYGGAGGKVWIHNSRQLFLCNAEGVCLTEVRQTIDVVHNDGLPYEWEDGERVGDAVARVHRGAVAYIVERHTGYVVRNSCSVGGYAVTVYPIPAHADLAGWVSRQREEARARLEKELQSLV